jgi:hypothetical protein
MHFYIPCYFLRLCCLLLQLSTRDPWSVENRRPFTADPPSVAQLLISMPFPASKHFPASSGRVPASMQPTWQPPSIAAALDKRLVWWRMNGSDEVAAGSSCRSNAATYQQQQQQVRCGDVVGTQLCSDPQHGHTAFVDALVELPAGGGSSTA